MWRSINELSKVDLQFPIIADPSREVGLLILATASLVLTLFWHLQIAKLYDMLDEQDLTNIDEKGYVL